MTRATLHFFYTLSFIALSLFPIFAHAQTDPAPAPTPATPPISSQYAFKSDGIFDCNYAGAGASSVGTMSAQGGVYVPVSDAAVTLNTGYLVYKECSLRKLIDAERMSAVSALLKKAQTTIDTGRDGKTYYVVNEGDELLVVSDKAAVAYIKGPSMQKSAFADDIQKAVARAYYANTRSKDEQLTCPYAEIKSLIMGQTFSLEGFMAQQNPACNPYLAGQAAYEQMSSRIAAAMDYQRDQWDWGRGVYARTDNAEDPLEEQTLTPASVMQESYQQLLGSSVRQLESANDVGQMVSALFAGVTTQAISSNQGLAGLTQSYGGQPSYMDQLVKESQNNLIGNAVNTALQILNAVRQIETNYNQTINAVATNLLQTIGQLRGAENQCWVLITQKTCTSAPSGGTCTDTSGNVLQIATSTAFSQAIVGGQVAPIASTTILGLQKSNLALRQIDQLITGLTNTTSVNSQRIALQQLDTLIAQGAIHTATDLTNLQQQQTAIKSSMENLVQNTAQTWGDGTPNTANPYDANSGWCNVNNATTVSMWAQLWKI